jgi:hypothetical protein
VISSQTGNTSGISIRTGLFVTEFQEPSLIAIDEKLRLDTQFWTMKVPDNSA